MAFTISGLVAAYFQRDVAGTLTRVAAPWVKEASLEPEQEDITWEGDGITRTLAYNTGLTGEMVHDAYMPDVKAAIFGETATTASLPANVTHRYIQGTENASAGKTVGIELIFAMVDENDGSTKYGRVWVPKATISEPSAPSGLASKSTAQHTFNFTAIRGDTDIAGDAITGATADALWFFDVMSTSSAATI